MQHGHRVTITSPRAPQSTSPRHSHRCSRFCRATLPPPPPSHNCSTNVCATFPGPGRSKISYATAPSHGSSIPSHCIPVTAQAQTWPHYGLQFPGAAGSPVIRSSRHGSSGSAASRHPVTQSRAQHSRLRHGSSHVAGHSRVGPLKSSDHQLVDGICQRGRASGRHLVLAQGEYVGRDPIHDAPVGHGDAGQVGRRWPH